MPQWLSDLWKYLTTDDVGKQILAGLIVLLVGGLLTLLVRLSWLVFKHLRHSRAPRTRDEVSAFEVIADPDDIPPKLLNSENDASPLAAHNITYQRRDPGRDLQFELRRALNEKRYLLITAPTGYGKTREAATLSRALMNEGWRAVRVRPGWLDAPKDLPPGLGSDRHRVLILLDDLNQLFSHGGYVQLRQAAETPGLPSYHDGLVRALDAFEQMCGENEIRVIATARDEADEWQRLNFDERDELWRRFKRVILPAPREKAVVALLDEAVTRASLPAERDDFPAIARANDGRFSTIVQNLQSAQREGQPVSLADFKPKIDDVWHTSYVRARGKHPAVRYFYEALDVLRRAHIELYLWIVEPTAQMLWGGNALERIARRRAVNRALRYLTEEQKILAQNDSRLAPKDGQIEAKGDLLDWHPYSDSLQSLVLALANQRRNEMVGSLISFGATLYEAKQYEQVAALMKKGQEIAPRNAVFSYNLGVVLNDLQRPVEAEQAYRDAITCDPNDAAAYNNLGLLLHEKLNRPSEAEQAYRDAITRDPNYAKAYYNLGSLLGKLNRPSEAEQAYRDAITRDPNDAAAYSNLGLLLHEKLNRPSEAEQAYRDAITRDPNDAAAYNNLIFLLRLQQREREAKPLLDKLVALAPQEKEILLTIAGFYKQLGDTAASAQYAADARTLIPADDGYSLACLESICGNVDLALAHLRRAAQQPNFDRAWARRDPDLEWIRDGPRFEEILKDEG